MEGCLYKFTPYTIINNPIGVVYEGVDNRKRLMRLDKLHKFSDDTLNKTKDDDKKTRKFVEKIEKTLKERRRFRRLELFVGGRRDKTDYRLLISHE
ncbi:hypothetical protein Tco_1208235 [Tanacetum coccineum]